MKYKQLNQSVLLAREHRFEYIRVKRYLANEQDFFVPHVDVSDQLNARCFTKTRRSS